MARAIGYKLANLTYLINERISLTKKQSAPEIFTGTYLQKQLSSIYTMTTKKGHG